jgi:hypothetical protein
VETNRDSKLEAYAYGHMLAYGRPETYREVGGRTDRGPVRANTPHLRRRGVFVGRCARAVRLLQETSISPCDRDDHRGDRLVGRDRA